MSRGAQWHAKLLTWVRSLTTGPDPARQPGCTCEYKPVAERGGRRVVQHQDGCAVIGSGVPVRLIAGDNDPIMIGTIRIEGDGDPDVGLGLFVQEWAAAYLTQLARQGRQIRKTWIR